MTARNETTKSTTTLDYYNKNAKKFISGTISVDFGIVQNRFLDKLHPGAEILDYGCGSGRDTKYFLEQGCKVTAIDGSQELCKLASEYTGIPVKHMLFQELNEKEAYDGIWACSSILHVPANELQDIIKKMTNALRAHGIIYTSFKYGTFEGERNGRYFTDMTEETYLNQLVYEAEHYIVETLNKYKGDSYIPTVSFSGGKDSTVVSNQTQFLVEAGCLLRQQQSTL